MIDVSFSIELASTKPISHKLINKFDKLKFCSLTWHIKTTTDDEYITNVSEIPVLQLAKLLIKANRQVLLHVPCQNLTKYEALLILDYIKVIGVRHLLAVRGGKQHTIETISRISTQIRDKVRVMGSIGILSKATKGPGSCWAFFRCYIENNKFILQY